MEFPLTPQLRTEARTFELRSSCEDCFFWRADRCAHEWPLGSQVLRIERISQNEDNPEIVDFCKEFELA